MNQKPLATPTFEKKDLARLVRQAAKSDSALQSFLAEHGDAHVAPNRQSGQLLAAQQQLLASVDSQQRQRLAGEESLRESDRRFRTLIEHSCDGLSLVDADDRILYLSPAVTAIEGYTQQEMLGRQGIEHTHPDDLQLVQRLAKELLANPGKPLELIWRRIHKNGQVLWLEGMCTNLLDDPAVRAIVTNYRDVTKRTQAAEESQRVAERLTTILESITDSFFMLDRDWRFTYVNRQTELVFRRTRSDLLGRTIWNEFPQLRNTDIHREYLRASAENVAVHFEAFSHIFNAWLDLRVYPSVQGLAVYFRDVSEQHKAHEDLIISAERFRLLSKATNDAIWDFETATDQVSWNEGFETLFGYPRTDVELTIESWTNRIHADDHDRVVTKMQEAVANNASTWSDEFRFRRKDGGYSYVLNRCHIIRTATGTPARIIGGMTDLTTRKKAEERIAEQAALLDKAQDAISVRDLTHHVSYWNKSAELLYGWNAAEIAGKSARELLYKDATGFDRAVNEVIEHGEWNGELSPTSKAGRQLLIDSRLTLVRDGMGKPMSVLSICTDITDRRKLEQQYLRAQRLESIGTLAGGIAHDLNNVLAPIMLSITLLMKDEKDDKRIGILSIIDASAKRGADMVRHVLSFARGVEGHRLPVQIASVMHEIEKIVNDTFLKNIQVKTRFSPDVSMVSGDSTQLHQVVLNLCVNARDAMPDGGILELTLDNVTLDEHFASLHIEAKPGSYVVIGIEDSGSGIAPELMEKIFEPFFTTKEFGKGTGLGLSTSLAVVKSHSGFMSVYSEVGQGTSFKLYFPAMTAENSVSKESDRPTLPLGHGELVMVVDDEFAVRQITCQTLEAYGYRVILAADGSEALSLFAVQQNDISLVITDMMMPVMDGNATIRVLTRMRPSVRIIAASGLNENHVIAKAMSNGVKHFLAKPYTAESLLTKIYEALM